MFSLHHTSSLLFVNQKRLRHKYRMRGLFETLTEAPIGDITLHGDFDAPGSMDYEGDFTRGAPKKLVRKPAHHHAMRRFFKNCPYVINVHFVNIPNSQGNIWASKYSPEAVKTMTGFDIKPDPKAINVIYTSNRGDDAVPMTPWIVAHRLGHTMAEGHSTDSFDKYWDKFVANFEQMSRLLVMPLGDSKKYAPPSAVLSMIGTTKMCRDGKAIRIGEWFHDSVAQYILKGSISLLPARAARNDIPFVVAQGWGYPSGTYRIKPDADFDAVDKLAQRTVRDTEMWINRLLKKSVGPFFMVI